MLTIAGSISVRIYLKIYLSIHGLNLVLTPIESITWQYFPLLYVYLLWLCRGI